MSEGQFERDQQVKNVFALLEIPEEVVADVVATFKITRKGDLCG